MIIKELIKILQNQHNNLSLFLENAEKKQHAIVNFDYDDLEKSIMAEEKSLFQIHTLENERINQLTNFYSEHSIQYKSLRINELLDIIKDKISPETIERITTLEKNIKEKILEINKVNIQNTFLIEHSRSFIKETINSLVSLNKQHLDKKV